MQNLKDHALIVSKKKGNVKFFLNKEIYLSYLSPLNMCNSPPPPPKGNIFMLLDTTNNHTNFQLNQIRTHNFQLNTFNTDVMLKYNQGNWKWYEWVKLNEHYRHTKFDIYHVYCVRKNRSIKVSATYR